MKSFPYIYIYPIGNINGIYSQCEFIKETLNKLLQIKRITLYYKIFIPSTKTILLTVSFSHSNLLTKQTNFQRTFSPFNFHPHFKSKNERINILKNKVSKKKKKIAKHLFHPTHFNLPLKIKKKTGTKQSVDKL